MINLPPLVLFNQYPSYEEYIEAVYAYFRHDFLKNKVLYLNKPIICYPDPKELGKEASFWHLITKDTNNHGRPIDFRRSERIRWPKPVISECQDESIKIWEEVKKNKKGKNQIRVHFCFGNWEYLVVLTKRPNHWVFCTAYPIFENENWEVRYKQKLQKRYKDYVEKQTPPF
jgi:hypothetical protein